MGTEFGPSSEDIGLPKEKPLQETTKESLPDPSKTGENQEIRALPEPIKESGRDLEVKTKQALDVINKERESAELAEKTNLFSNFVETNARVFKTSVNLMKKYPQLTGFLVSASLGALSMIGNTPIPPEILSKMAAGIGGGSFGYSKAPEGFSKKMAYSIGGALAAAGAVEGAGHMMNENAAGVAANFVDDIPSAAAGVLPAIKKVGEVAKNISEKKNK